MSLARQGQKLLSVLYAAAWTSACAVLLHTKQSLASCDRVRCSFMGWEWPRLGMGSRPGTAFGTFSTARPVKREKNRATGSGNATNAPRTAHAHRCLTGWSGLESTRVMPPDALRCVRACSPARGGALPHEQQATVQQQPKVAALAHMHTPTPCPSPYTYSNQSNLLPSSHMHGHTD